MSSPPRYSVVVPVYNRPQEVDELLESLRQQTYQNFEVVLVEDGSTVTSDKVFEKYSSAMPIRYFFKPNTGPGPSRNFGFEKARGDYFVVFDSDCVIPPGYFRSIEDHLKMVPLDVWGGPDRGHPDFTPLQKAMAYTMSSILTTGGIRGNQQHLGSFQPRSFNMGLSRTVFKQTRGFKFARYAEDIEFSIRAGKLGFRVGLIPEAFVFHKRRTTLEEFFNQVTNFGRGRVQVGKVHPGAVKLTHWFPAFFLSGLVVLPFLFLFKTWLGLFALAAYVLYLLAVCMDAYGRTGSAWVAILAAPAVVMQMTGYGYGFLKEKFKPSL